VKLVNMVAGWCPRAIRVRGGMVEGINRCRVAGRYL
jgi:hypothetical protein